ncbi:alpha/beta hydrolase [Pseudotabrizicola algicola]|uniref:Alpha/beta hydrolase n=1 Tax=Pseudotabrizicola algicola TaxID=2709381 RepID=A0A6B3RWP1_9RHOB|nr:alpha/beta hydrolase [Pseudotabrizicola algicola]NEX47439.1 alpha/beta hydrolase [Pseudotabrizicola algicola]
MDFASAADRAYANGAFIPGADGFVPKWQAQAAAFRGEARAELGLAYGAGARQGFDLFLPEATPRGLMVFLHGGYWMAFDRGDWSHLAAGAVARGWACAVPSYTLAPEARIADMTGEAAAAVRAAAARVPGPVVVTGHSAGGHLAARMACEGGPEVARVVPISPLADLRPLLETQMAATLRLDSTEAAAESPALLRPRAGVQAHVWVGGQERPAFLWQARVLSEEWACPWTVEAGRHHFEVVDGLTDPESALVRACLDGL